MKMHVHTEEQADTITLMLPAIKNPHKVHSLQCALPPQSPPRGRILMSGGATDGHEENKSMDVMVRLVMHCGRSGGSGKLDGGDGGWLGRFRRSPKPLTWC